MPTLTATYAQSSTPEVLSRDLPALADGTQARVEYLAALQTAAREMQGEVNRLLTGKMEEDAKEGGKDKDKEEEEGYGEEGGEVA